MTIFFINDQYDDRALGIYKEFQVTLPVKNVPYTIREVKLTGGEYILLLNEIKNEGIFINKKYAGEPGFHYARFTEVPYNVLEWEKVDKIYKAQSNSAAV